MSVDTAPDEAMTSPVRHQACRTLGSPVDVQSRLGTRTLNTSGGLSHPDVSTQVGPRSGLIRWISSTAGRVFRPRKSVSSNDVRMRWRVELHGPPAGPIHREVRLRHWHDAADSSWMDWGATLDWRPELYIWPSWHQIAAEMNAGEPNTLVETDELCKANATRLRNSAKWMSTVIGITMGTIIGTTPLQNMTTRPEPAWILVIIGLGLLATTLVLVVRVMQPRPVAFEDILAAGSRHPLGRWRQLIEQEQDLYLPCGIRCLETLRETMLVEELTLNCLALAVDPHDKDQREELTKAIKGRMYRVDELRKAVSHIVNVAGFYLLRRQTTITTYAGGAMATAAAIAIGMAFAYPM